MSCKPNSFSQNLIRLMCDRCVLEMYPAFRVRTHHETGNARKFAKLLCQLGNPVDVQLGNFDVPVELTGAVRFHPLYMSDVQHVDIGRQIVVMECLGIQAFPFLRTRLKGLTSQ